MRGARRSLGGLSTLGARSARSCSTGAALGTLSTLGAIARRTAQQEFMAAIFSAAPVERPEKKPLAPRVPEGPARELPNGRGFLRVVSGGKGAPSAPTPWLPRPLPLRRLSRL